MRKPILSARALGELRQRYVEQLPTVAALLLMSDDGDSPMSFQEAAIGAVEIMNEVLEALMEG